MSKAKKKEKAPARKKAADKPVEKPAVEAAAPKKADVKITAATGRPMLTWVGKRPLSHVTAFPAQHVETFAPHSELKTPNSALWANWPSAYPKGGLLFHGDNKEVLAHLLANGFRGKVNLVYIDPPFDSGADYVRKVTLRGSKGSVKLDGETYTLGEQIQYSDIWANDNYLQFMYERLMLLKELLAEDGSIYLHCDWNKSHHLRCLMDEVLGSENIKNEIVWKRTSARSDSKTYNHIHDTIFFYTKRDSMIWNQLLTPHSEEYLDRYYCYKEKDGRRFMALNLTADGIRNGSSGKAWRGFDPNTQSNHWKYAIETLDRLDMENRIYWPGKEGGWPRLKKYLDETKGRAIQSIWEDIFTVNSQAEERTEYPTQKSETLLERIILASSNPGNIVLDCFAGSGTTAVVAQKLGRRWIGCDINKGAIQTTAKRLQAIINEQIEAEKNRPLTLPLMVAENPPQSPFSQGGGGIDAKDGIPPLTKGGEGGFRPAQHSFSTWRVNDYDLAIQHNEAVNLACEHIGIERMRTDAYFDGTYRKSLVKIIPFGHPLTPLDLEELRRELEARPDEDRPITVVCLGMELAAKAWIEDWNRLRKGRDAVNKVEVIELRTDPKYGKFMQHEQAKAKVKITRKKDKIAVEIEDFISPTIIERLSQQAGLLKPKIDDWRAMVDCVMIDTAYDGKVFNVMLSDVPEKKTDLVQGSYELDTPGGETTVAVKIIDMLGEEVLVTKSA